ncbi:MAG: N-acetylglucosaminidase [Clostridium sp.]|uniref:N-acetylglucosaminidase n=1 Tax=Clostridium sp. TaxID=1506 RepID=UPI003D6D1C6F
MKKILSVIVLVISLIILSPRSVLALDKPSVSFVGVSHSPLIQGDKEKFYITSKNVKEVQYRIFLYEENTKLWTEFTSGYTEFMNAQIPYEISPEKVFKLGKYKVSIWARAKGSNANYDSFYVSNLNCVSRDDNNRVYLDGNMDVGKTEYMVGDKVEINGIENIRGMKAPYKYKLHVYNATKDKWSTHVTNYSQDKITWQPTEAGAYVIDVWAMSANSTLWSKVTANESAAAYEGWKLKVINVTKSNTSLTSYNCSLDNITDIQYGLKASVTYTAGKWILADRNEIKYYMDPTNFLNGDGKYQFLKLNYTKGISVNEINAVLQGKGVLNGKGQAFLDSCITYNVSPAYLISHAFLETGYGKSVLASGVIVTQVKGKPVPPKVSYNMFGIGAYDADPTRLGSEYAYTNGWFSVEQAVAGGANWISKNYINNSSNNQNTLYKMRWNPNGAGNHQYATDIGWANKQTKNIKAIMDKFTNSNMYFDVPKYLY